MQFTARRMPGFSVLTAVARPAAARPHATSPRRPPSAAPEISGAGADSEGIRVNKCFRSFASRRESDTYIARQRVTINEAVACPGARVRPGDVVRLDGEMVDWERLNLDPDTSSFVYVKHWKAAGVVCTTSAEEPDNIVAQVVGAVESGDRMFPIGRLDEASTGIILLTSDGRLPNAVLGAGKGCAKEYLVVPDVYVSDGHLEMMRRGVFITTVAQRERSRPTLRAATLPCSVQRGEGSQLLITLQEGRNRQIRKMLGALGYTTRAIHRVGFMGIGLDRLAGPGDSCALNEAEMKLIEERLRPTASS